MKTGKFLSLNRFHPRPAEVSAVSVLARSKRIQFRLNFDGFIDAVSWVGFLPNLQMLEKLKDLRFLEEVVFENAMHRDKACFGARQMHVILGCSKLRGLLVNYRILKLEAVDLFQLNNQIEVLRLRSCSLTDTHLASIASMKKLHSLTIAENSDVTLDGIVTLLDCISLENIYLGKETLFLDELTLLLKEQNHPCSVHILK